MTQANVHNLRRGGTGGSSAVAGGAVVARPRRRWVTRVGVPGVVLAGAAVVLGWSMREAWRARVAVEVVPVVGVAGVVDGGGEARVEAGGGGGGVATPAAGWVVQAPGWVEPAPYAVGVPALAEGVVESVEVLEGQPVKAGEVVARLVSRDAELAVRSAEAQVAQKRADVSRARAAVATAEAAVAVDRAAAEEVADSVNRERELLSIGGVGAGEFRRQEIRLEGLRAKVAASELVVSEARVAVLQAEAALAVAEVAGEEARLRRERMEIRSPISGVVLARLVGPGTRINLGSDAPEAGTVLRVYDPESLQVRVDVPLADAGKVGVGSRAEVSSEATGETAFAGEVVRVVHEANIQRNTVQFKVKLRGESEAERAALRRLKPEMLTRVRLLGPGGHVGGSGSGGGGGGTGGGAAGTAGGVVPRDGGAVLMPARALGAAGAGEGAVWVMTPEAGSDGRAGVVRRVEVATAGGANADGWVVVRSGLRLGDRVVVGSAGTLREGAAVRWGAGGVGGAGGGVEMSEGGRP
ncbi:MAG: efflux RND transporter periplasmic adaptor subunit [Planctomycetaceae bacterium]|nr:efflux RND transporter periplasmic adaptor subunit [Planctomycetaceae bacterium]